MFLKFYENYFYLQDNVFFLFRMILIIFAHEDTHLEYVHLYFLSINIRLVSVYC